jgi:hypothetical protein
MQAALSRHLDAHHGLAQYSRANLLFFSLQAEQATRIKAAAQAKEGLR